MSLFIKDIMEFYIMAMKVNGKVQIIASEVFVNSTFIGV